MRARLPSGTGILKAVALGSLCLNVLLGAYVATQWLNATHAGLITAAPPRLMELIASRLPAGDADALWQTYRAREKEFAAAQSDYQSALADAAAELAQDDVDWEKFKTSVDEARGRRLKVGDLAIATFLDALPKMSVEGRRGLVKSIRRPKIEGNSK